MRRISNGISLLLIVALVVGLVAFCIGNGTQFSLSVLWLYLLSCPGLAADGRRCRRRLPPGILRAHPWAAARRLGKQPPAQQDLAA